MFPEFTTMPQLLILFLAVLLKHCFVLGVMIKLDSYLLSGVLMPNLSLARERLWEGGPLGPLGSLCSIASH